MSHHSSPHSPPSYPISEVSLPANADEDADMVGNDNDENDDNDEGVNSLPDSGTSDDIDDIDESEGEGESDAEREWKESLQQLELLLTMVVVPYVGKYFGRKCAYWSWAKFMEWKYPSVEVVITSKQQFRTAGAVAVAASL